MELEKHRRKLWEEGLLRWRILRTRHAMHVFNERIRWVTLRRGLGPVGQGLGWRGLWGKELLRWRILITPPLHERIQRA